MVYDIRILGGMIKQRKGGIMSDQKIKELRDELYNTKVRLAEMRRRSESLTELVIAAKFIIENYSLLYDGCSAEKSHPAWFARAELMK